VNRGSLITPEEREELSEESRVRRLAAKHGYCVKKSHIRTTPNLDNFGGYRVTDADTNCVVWGTRFELTLEDVAKLFRGKE
jgi:hypothetical protein